MANLTFADFSPFSLVFEARYPPAYLLWDNAGKIAGDLQNGHEDVKRTKAEPGKIAFVVDSRNDVSWEIELMSVADHKPSGSKSDAFSQLSTTCFDSAVRHLGISQLKRVGFRSLFVKKYTRKEDAAGALLALGLIHIPSGKLFNIEPTQRYPEYAIRCEDEKFGYTLRLGIREVKYELELGPQWKGAGVEPTSEHQITLDVDYYIHATLPIGSFNVEQWLGQVSHAIRRDADSYLGRR